MDKLTGKFPCSVRFLVDVEAGLLGAVYLGTTLISLLVTNNAAAALMFPIAIDAAERAGTDVLTMCFCLMLGASDYASPFGYQYVCDIWIVGV